MNDATRDLLEQHFETAFAAPDGIKKIRELILTWAMQGKLAEQAPTDQPASELLKDIDAEKQRLVKAGKIKAPKPLPPIKPEEVPYQLPQGWKWVRLGGIASYIQRGKGPTYTDSSTHKVISQKCVRWYGLDIEPARYIDPESLQKYEAIRFLRAGDLLWNSTGTGTIGRACLVPENFKNHEMVVDSHVTVVRPVLISPLFLWRWIQSPIVQDEIEGSASGTTNQIELNTSTVVNHLMPLPPLPEQHRIVARIDQLMACCDTLEALRKEREEKRQAVHAAAMQQLLEVKDGAAWGFVEQHFGELYSVKANVAELRKAILQLAVMGRLVPQAPTDQPASELLKEIDAEKQRLVKAGKIKPHKPLPTIKPDEVPYQLPQGWEWVRLGNVALSSESGWSPQCNFEPRTGNQWGVLKVSAVSWGAFNPNENKALPILAQPRPECEVQCGDFLISRANTDELVARSVIVGNTPPRLMLSDKIVRFNLSSHVNKFFINHVNGANSSRAHYTKNASGTSSSMKNVSRETMSLLPIPLAPIAEQCRIVARIDQLMALCDTLEQKVNDATDKQTELLTALMAQV